MRVHVRSWVDGELAVDDFEDIDESRLDSLVAALGAKHAEILRPRPGARFMVEIEFLDEPDPLQRFFRFGNDPDGMVAPIAIDPGRVQ